MHWCYHGKIVLNYPDLKISKKNPSSDSLAFYGAKSIVDITIHLIHFSDLWDRDQEWVALSECILWYWCLEWRANWNSIYTGTSRPSVRPVYPWDGKTKGAIYVGTSGTIGILSIQETETQRKPHGHRWPLHTPLLIFHLVVDAVYWDSLT